MKIILLGLLLVCIGANAQDDSLAGSFLSGMFSHETALVIRHL